MRKRAVHGTPQPREYHYEVLNNPQLTPLAMMVTLFSALQNANDYGSEVTYHINGKIRVGGYPDISLQNMFAPADGGTPAALGAALLLSRLAHRTILCPHQSWGELRLREAQDEHVTARHAVQSFG